MMKSIRGKWSIPAFLLFFLLGVHGPARAESCGEKNCGIHFFWSLVAVSEEETIPIAKKIQLKTGDRFKMYLELDTPCSVYVLYLDSTDHLHRMFPYPFDPPSHAYKKHKKYYIPQDEYWLELNGDLGIEKFYLMASDKPLIDLEKLLSSHDAAQSPEAKLMAKNEILSQVLALRKEYRNLSKPAERPILIGGNLRGVSPKKEEIKPDILEYAIEICADSFFHRIFFIDHRSK